MKNPFTGKEMQKKSFAEIFGLNFSEKGDDEQSSVPGQYDLLKEEVEALKAENAAYKAAFAEIAKSDTNSIAKIRAIAKQCVDATEGSLT